MWMCFFARSVCYKGWQSFCSLLKDWMKFAKKWRKPLKKRDVPRPKRLQRASEEIHNNILDGINQDKVCNMSRTLVNQEKVSKSLQFGTGEATTYTSVNSSCQDFPSWKRPVPAYLPGFQIKMWQVLEDNMHFFPEWLQLQIIINSVPQ